MLASALGSVGSVEIYDKGADSKVIQADTGEDVGDQEVDHDLANNMGL